MRGYGSIGCIKGPIATHMQNFFAGSLEIETMVGVEEDAPCHSCNFGLGPVVAHDAWVNMTEAKQLQNNKTGLWARMGTELQQAL